VLVDRPDKAKALFSYPVIWAAGDVDLGSLAKPLEDYVRKGGTLVVYTTGARNSLPESLLGFALSGKFRTFEEWKPAEGQSRPATPYEVELGKLAGAEVIAWATKDVPLVVRHKVGDGAVILILVPRGLGLDELAHPILPYLINGLTDGLLPVEVRMPGGQRPSGEILYQVNQTKDGYVVLLMNNRGVDKTQNGVARVDRRQSVDVLIRTARSGFSIKEYTSPRELIPLNVNGGTEVRIRVHPGDVQVVGLVAR